MQPMLELAVKLLIAYLLGSIVGSLLLGWLRGVDIRTMGSGNAGGTNALRTQGGWFALCVMIVDIGKGWIAAAWLPSLALPSVGLDPAIDRQWLAVGCAAAAVLGHVYPVWHGFRGGKGAATLVGVVLGLRLEAVLLLLVVWLVVVMLTGYVSLGTMLSAAAFPVYLALRDSPQDAALLTFGCAMAVFVCYTHRSNIQRILSGTESRAQRLWLLRSR
jgi:acyl phosphate:glycerol-3-phosphate acyltransferase